MNESDLYKELGVLTRNRDKWEDSIPLIEPYWENLFRFAEDDDAKVRLSPI